MAKILPVGHLREDIVESGVDTYTEQTINTNVNPLNNQILLIHDISIQWYDTPGLLTEADLAECAILRQSKNAMPNLDDPDVIALRSDSIIISTSGGGLYDLTKNYHFDPPEPVAVDTLVLAVQGTSLGETLKAAVDIRYTPDKISDAEFIKLSKS